MPTPILPAAISVNEQVINPFSISHITEMGRLDNTEYLFFFSFLSFLIKTHLHKFVFGKGDETRE